MRSSVSLRTSCSTADASGSNEQIGNIVSAGKARPARECARFAPEIAGRLVISPLIAKTHVSRILGKFDCRDRAQLVTLAYETGLVTPAPAQRRNDQPD
jgi:hypothetical protein